jgi:hypothetical protein
MLITLHRAGFRIKEVPVRMYANASGKSMHAAGSRFITCSRCCSRFL